jgi:hypothetical protein
LTPGALRDSNWDVGGWEPLITAEKTFIDWLVARPDAAALAGARRVTQAQIARLEELWRWVAVRMGFKWGRLEQY